MIIMALLDRLTTFAKSGENYEYGGATEGNVPAILKEENGATLFIMFWNEIMELVKVTQFSSFN